MTRRTRYSQVVRERAVRMVFEHGSEYASEWEAICSISEKIGCSPESLRKWIRKSEVNSGQREGITSEEQARVKALERENRELRGGRKNWTLAHQQWLRGLRLEHAADQAIFDAYCIALDQATERVRMGSP